MSESVTNAALYRRSLLKVLGLVMLLAAVSLGCSVGQALVGRAGVSAPTPTKTPRPTFTPLPGVLTPLATSGVTVRGTLPPGVVAQVPAPGGAPVAEGTPQQGVIEGGSTELLLYATDTPAPSPTPEPLQATPQPTGDVETNRPTRESGPRPQPTPYVVVNTDTLNARRGPGTTFERVGQVKRGDQLMVLGKTPDGTWINVCCVANQPVWVFAELVTEMGAVDLVTVVTPAPTPIPPPPAPIPPPQPTRTPAPTPAPPFDIARGPEFPIQRDNGIMTIYIKVYEGPPDNQTPLPGYILKVLRNGVDVSDNEQSFGDREFEHTAISEGNLETNLKFEMVRAGEADWEIYLARPGGFRVSPITKFTTMGDSYRNLVVYIAYWLAR
jgi:hypothetical protein